MRTNYHSAGWKCLAALVIANVAAVAPLQARINVTTLPGRDTVQLTVYNSADLTMVKETRTLVFVMTPAASDGQQGRGRSTANACRKPRFATSSAPSFMRQGKHPDLHYQR